MEKIISPRLENYINEISSKSSSVKLDSYFHVDAVIDAYSRGEQSGIEQTLEILREKMVRDSTKMFLYSTDVVQELRKKNYQVSSIFVNPFDFKFLLIINQENTVNEEFIDSFYNLAFKAEKKFLEETGNSMHISFLPDLAVNAQELKVDGFIKIG